MEITNINRQQLVPTSIADFGMPTGGQSCFGVVVEPRGSWVPATGLSITGTDGMTRDRKDLAVKGHVALAAYVPGYPAWSPPIC